jgi:putative spermidine/putrescine transport system ATP-binding protein
MDRTAEAVSVELVTKRYGGVTAVDDLSLLVRPGEFLALLGPSGCGKTTLLRLIAGFLTPERGSIRIAGRLVEHVPPYERNLGMVFQSYGLFPHMTVADNIAFGLKMRGLGRDDRRGRVSRALDLVRLPGYEGRYPSQLSGGQQQRVALARAIVYEPDVLLLDEPLGALDRKLREEMQLELKNLQRTLGVTTLFVTHDQEEALSMADRIAVMNGGRIEQLAAPADIYGRPATPFVSDFIGRTNIIPGRITRSGGAPRLVTAGGLALESPDLAELVDGAEARVALRPEKIVLSLDGALGGQATGTVRDAVYVGAQTHYFLELAGGDRMVASRQNGPSVASETGPVLSPGSEVRLGWDPGDVVVLRGEDAGSA